MPQHADSLKKPGDVVVLRYVTTSGRIEMCWPCRVVEDSPRLLALFMAAGSSYRADPKQTAEQKRSEPRGSIPEHEYIWRADMLRLMPPGRAHSVCMFWSADEQPRTLSRYFVNMEEPFRRTAIGFDTQDHTLDIVIDADFRWSWRDESELRSHVDHGFYTQALAASVREEGERTLTEILEGKHSCRSGWLDWLPDPDWDVPALTDDWAGTPPTFWSRCRWAYGEKLPMPGRP